MEEAGHPERGLRGALVGGTNGKGSVVAMTVSILGAAGLRVGSMPKPHLVSYRERIAVDGRPLSEEAFAAAIERAMPAIDRVAAEVGPPTEFEALTAAAIAELARQDVDLAIVEVGLGGRLDATNVLDLGVAAITNVQLDHEAILGPTLTAIGAREGADHQGRRRGGHRRRRPRAATDPRSGGRARRAAAARRPAPAVSGRAAPERLGRDRGGRPDPDTAAGRPPDRPARPSPGPECGGGPRGDRRAGRAVGCFRRGFGAAAGDGGGSLARAPRSARWVRRRPGSGPARWGAQPGGRRGAGRCPRRPRSPSPDDRVRRDADEEGAGGAPRPRAARPALHLHVGRRSRRP